LVREKLRGLRHLPAESSGLGFFILIPALLLLAIDAGLRTQLLSAVSLILVLPGLSLLFLGLKRSKEIAFPLLFSFFALPVPLALTEQVHLLLRKTVTANVSYILPSLNIPVFTEGTTIFLPHSTLLVADACSGFSTLYAVASIACLTAYLAPSRRRGLLVLCVVVPVAVAANTLRVLSLILLEYWIGGDILESFLHPLSGVLAFVLGIAVIFWCGQLSQTSSRPK